MTLPSMAPAAELPPAALPGEPRASLRERKKLATRRSLRRMTLDLVAERGFAHVTVEDIAEAADVSPRTFFNYFPSKEAALFGADPDRVAALRERVVHQAPGEPALDALRQVLVAEARMVTDELSELGGDPTDRLRRMKEVRADPHLRAAQSAHMAMLERAIDRGTRRAARHRSGPRPLPGPAGRHGHRRCSAPARSSGPAPAARCRSTSSPTSAFRALADGLPEHCALRQVTELQVTERQVQSFKSRGVRPGNVTDRRMTSMASATPAPAGGQLPPVPSGLGVVPGPTRTSAATARCPGSAGAGSS